MCGIVYSFRRDDKPAARQVLKRYSRQRERGQDGFGYVAIGEDRSVVDYRREQDEKGIRSALDASEARHILFHHRFPTSTVNIAEAAHPILVKHPELKHSYYVVHNGVVSNHKTIEPEHAKLGYRYRTAITKQWKSASGIVYTGDTEFNDSETLAIELARTIEGLQPAVRTSGSIALMALQCDKAGKKVKALYYGTNGGNPLTITNDSVGTVIASEGGQPIPSGIMYRKDFITNEITTPEVPLPYYYTTSGGYGTRPYALAKYEEEDYNPSAWESAPPTNYMLDDLEAQREGIEWDMEIARQAGEWEELVLLEADLEEIERQIETFHTRLDRRIGY